MGSIDLSMGAGTPPYTFLWSNAATTEDLTGLTAGTYSVVVTDSLGVIDSLTVTLIEPNILTANLSTTLHHGYAIACNGASTASIALTVNGGTPSYTYSWSNSESTQNLEGIGAGNYTVTVTDANGCSVSGNVTLAQPGSKTSSLSSPVNSFGFNISCDSTNGEIDLNVSGGVSGFRYNWNNGKLTQNIYNLDVGSYSVEVKDSNDCAVTDTITITAPVKMGVLSDSIVVYPNGKNMSCYGCQDGIIVAQPGSGTTPYSYLWNTSATTQTITGCSSVAAGYSVVVTDAGGCIKTLTGITLSNAPTPPPMQLSASKSDFNGNNISCHGNSDGTIDLSVAYGTPPFTYLWTNTATTQDLSGLIAGTYNVLVTDSFGFTDSLKITMKEPDVLTSALTPDLYNGYALKCHGSLDGSVYTKIRGGNTPYNFLWSDSSTLETLKNVGVGTYHVTVIDANNCLITDSITLTQPDAITDSISSPVNGYGFNVGCSLKDGIINLSASGGVTSALGYTYNWSNGVITQNQSNLYPGSYSVIVKDNNGCSKVDTITLTTPPPLTNLTDSINIYSNNANVSCDTCTDGVITALATGGTTPYTYLWSTAQTTQTITGCLPLPKTYNVQVTDAAGCKKSLERIMLVPPKSNDWKATGNYGSSGILGTLDSSDLKIVTNSSERMRVAANGNVGIGTQSPQEKFHVNGGNARIGGNVIIDSLAFTDTSANHNAYRMLACGANGGMIPIGPEITPAPAPIGTLVCGSGYPFDYWNYNYCDLVTWDNVGIGTHTPQSKLEVYGNDNSSATSAMNIASHNGTSILSARDDGHVGIGTANPIDRLQISTGTEKISFGNITAASGNGWCNSYIGFNAARNSATGYWTFEGNGYSDNGGTVIMSNIAGDLFFCSRDDGNGTTVNNLTDHDIYTDTKMIIRKDGSVGIGITPPIPGVMLDVCGSIRSKEWIVKTGWTGCDYVFDPEYKRMTWMEKAKYFSDNRHLPQIDSALEMQKNGFALAKTTQGILFNTEENSLDIIELYKLITELRKENLDLKKRLENLEGTK